ncbi:MAG: phage portal protein, partial [Firmicutes bacterium]|nr:phage portal protein [Bacillota bacterium]
EKALINFPGKNNEYSKMEQAVQRWTALYRGGSEQGKPSLNLAAAIAGEISRTVTIEMRSAVSGSARADAINAVYQKVIAQIRNYTELACALGGIVFKPCVTQNGIAVTAVRADAFCPIQFDGNNNITGAVFEEKFRNDKKIYTRCEKHFFENGRYIIENSAYESRSELEHGKRIPMSEVELWRGISEKVTIDGITKPLFAYFKMPTSNTIDFNSPLGVSVFASAENLIMDADKQYERILWEFESGERALYVDESAIRRDANGHHILPDKRLYRMLNTGEDALFEDWSPQFRDTSLINGLNRIFQRIEFNTGLAYGTISDPQGVDKTAEEIRSSKQRSYANVTDIQTALKKALGDLAECIDVLSDLYGLSPKGDYNISFDFDDSIISDRRAEFDEKMKLMQSGVLKPYEVRAWYLGEDEEKSKRILGGKENE